MIILDAVGAVLSFACTYNLARLNKNAWLLSMIAASLNAALYWQQGIFADSLLEIYYLISSFYGLLLWGNKTKESSLSVKRLSLSQGFQVCGVFVVLFILIRTTLIYFESPTIATLDAMTAGLSLVAQWLLCYKFIETWFLWFLADSIYAFLYFQQGIPFHVALMGAYLAMVFFGFASWNKQIKSNSVCSLSAN